MPRHPRNTFIAQPQSGTQRMYFVLAIIRYIMNLIEPNNSVLRDIKQLFALYPNIPLRAIGFPDSWEQESLWQ